MSSTSTPPKPAPGNSRSSQKEVLPTPSAFSSPPLPLPAPAQSQKGQGKGEGETTKLDVSGDGTTVKLDHLGPLVVNKDGTLSRIGNWVEMNEIERKNTLRIVGKRNQSRLTGLRGEADGGAKAPGHVGGGEGGGGS